ncbi:hypothetical protein HPB50_025600 [Hyalomma asiaticum]|uniref:Uncharacterized protein n=1 Tax=Hyalomma asiaticum TaxID=266040 RepID=A0ACB7T9D4_HYAAI|nr:hypothetical protein HPB50_025600 [Hyalomma asiaticum]
MSAVTNFYQHVGPLWIALAILRVCLVLYPQTGYIHPDEFFQSTEVVAGDLFGLKVHRTWEFTSPYPIRSIAIIWMTTLIPLSILKWIWSYVAMPGTLPPQLLFIMVPRIFACAASFACDYTIYHLSAPPAKRSRRVKALGIFASCYVTMVFYTRTFSNSVESWLLALLLLSVKDVMHGNELKLKDARVKVSRRYYSIAFLLCIGTFNRPTFICFALPAMIFWLCSGVSHNVKTKKCRTGAEIAQRLARRVVKLGGCFVLWAQYPIIVDTVYFYPDILSHGSPLHVVVTPLNFIRYNLNTTNLELHGEHPRFLHLLVNVPLLFNVLGILALWASCRVLYNRLSCNSRLEGLKFLTISKTFDIVAACTLLLPLFALSLFKHQEPRFLVPLLVPAVLVAQRHFSAKLVIFWSVANLLCLVFFGYIHQGGLLPCMAHVRDRLTQHRQDNTTATIMFAGTYMPPRHLLAVKQDETGVTIVDAMGTDSNNIELLLNFNIERTDLCYLITLPSLVDSVVKSRRYELRVLHSCYVHFSGEHPPQLSYTDYIDGKVSLSSLIKAFSLNVYLVKHVTT